MLERILCGLVLLLAACTTFDTPTPTPTHALSGPTLAPSQAVIPALPTELPPDFIGNGQNDPTAAALPSGGELPPLPIGTPLPDSERQSVQITAEDGTLLLGDLYQTVGVRQPGVLILATDRAAWGDFPLRLHAAGFTVLVMELRSTSGLEDFGVMLGALTSGLADPASLAVIGAGESADLAFIGCAVYLSCDTAVLLSPLSRDALLNVMPNYNPRPLLLAASRDDTQAFAAIQTLEEAARGETLFQPFESAGRGTAMLQSRPELADLIVTWLERQLG